MNTDLRRTARAAGCLTLVGAGLFGLSACGSSSSASDASAATTPAKAAHTTTTVAAAAAPATVKATLREYAIATAPRSVRAGRVVFDVTNAGKIKHQFTVIRTAKPAAKALSHQNPDDDIPGARGEISSLKPGATKRLVIKHLKPGHYALVCALPGHYQSGMYTDFTVTG